MRTKIPTQFSQPSLILAPTDGGHIIFWVVAVAVVVVVVDLSSVIARLIAVFGDIIVW